MNGDYDNIGQITQLAIGFMFLYMTFNSSKNIYSLIMEQDGF